MTNEERKRKKRVIEICGSFPETDIEDGQHVAFRIRKRTFAYYLNDHHGDGIIALCFKAAPGVQEMLIQTDEERFYIPSYLGPKGWVSMRIDTASVDWEEVEDFAIEAYSLVASKRLVKLIKDAK